MRNWTIEVKSLLIGLANILGEMGWSNPCVDRYAMRHRTQFPWNPLSLIGRGSDFNPEELLPYVLDLENLGPLMPLVRFFPCFSQYQQNPDAPNYFVATMMQA